LRPWIVLTLLVGALPARAQSPTLRIVGPDADAWTPRFDAPLPAASPREAHVERSRLGALAAADALVARARQAAADLDEGTALSALTRARGLVEGAADVAGASRWLAEVELILGVVAQQAGHEQLAEESFANAATLDPTRLLLAAEAPPAVAARAAEVRQTGREDVRVRIQSSPVAEVYLDDRRIGETPVTVVARAGRHVLRLEAPGHRPLGEVVALDAATTWTRELEPTREEAMRRRVLAAEDARMAAAAGTPVLFVATSEGPRERAVTTVCSEGRCTMPARVTPGESAEPGPPVPWAEWDRAWAAAVEWRDSVPTPPPPPRVPWYRHWATWVAVGAALAGAAVGLGFALRPDPEQELRVNVMCGDRLCSD